MKMIKNLSKANIRNYEGFEVREDLNFTDDGNYFRGFSYKGMPITTMRKEEITYLSIRVDYLENEFTFKEWAKTEEFKLEDEFNGVFEFDMDKLIENLEKVIAKVAEMNEAARNEKIDTNEVEATLASEIMYAEMVIESFKKNFKWYEVSEYKLKSLLACLKNLQRDVDRARLINFDELDRKTKKHYIESLENYGYVLLDGNGYYIREMKAALENN